MAIKPLRLSIYLIREFRYWPYAYLRYSGVAVEVAQILNSYKTFEDLEARAG